MTYRHGSFEVVDLDVADHVCFANYVTVELKSITRVSNVWLFRLTAKVPGSGDKLLSNKNEIGKGNVQ